MHNTYIQVPFLSRNAPWKPGAHSIALAFSSDMRRFAIAVARRESVPIIVHAHEGDIDEHGLQVYKALFHAAGEYGVRRIHSREYVRNAWLPPLLRIDSKPPPDAPFAMGPPVDGLLLDAVELAAAGAMMHPTLEVAREREERRRTNIQRICRHFW